MIKGEHGQEIKAQIHALEEGLPPPQRYGAPRNQQLFDRSPKHPRPAYSISGYGPLPSSAMKRSMRLSPRNSLKR
jgi:hypothetical protein